MCMDIGCQNGSCEGRDSWGGSQLQAQRLGGRGQGWCLSLYPCTAQLAKEGRERKHRLHRRAQPLQPFPSSPAGVLPRAYLTPATRLPSLTSPKLVTCDARLRPSPRGQRLGSSSKAYPFSLNGNGGSRSCSRAVRGPNDGESPLRLRGGFRWDPSRTPRRGLGSETFGPRDPALPRAGRAGNRRPPPQGMLRVHRRTTSPRVLWVRGRCALRVR